MIFGTTLTFELLTVLAYGNEHEINSLLNSKTFQYFGESALSNNTFSVYVVRSPHQMTKLGH